MQEYAESVQEQLNNAKKHIEHVIGTIKHNGHLGTIQTDWILPDLEKALAEIGAAMSDKKCQNCGYELDMQYIATDEQEVRLYKNTFTQQEIDSMQTGSYEQIEVVE